MFTYKLIQHLFTAGGQSNANKDKNYHSHRIKPSDLPIPVSIPSDSSDHLHSSHSSQSARSDSGSHTPPLSQNLRERTKSNPPAKDRSLSGSPALPPHRLRASSIDRGYKHRGNGGSLPAALRPTSNFILFSSYVIAVGVLLTLCDHFFHVRFEVLKYNDVSPESSYFPEHPTLEVLKGFLGIGVFCVLSGTLFFGNSKSTMIRATLSLIVFVVEYYFSGAFKEYPLTLHNAFLAVWVLQLLSFSSLRLMVPYCVLLGILGPVVEGYYTTTGFFSYQVPDVVYHVPIWLSSLYMNGGVAVAASLCWVNNFKYHV